MDGLLVDAEKKQAGEAKKEQLAKQAYENQKKMGELDRLIVSLKVCHSSSSQHTHRNCLFSHSFLHSFIHSCTYAHIPVMSLPQADLHAATRASTEQLQSLASLTGTNRRLERSLNANQTLVGVDPEMRRQALEVSI